VKPLPERRGEVGERSGDSASRSQSGGERWERFFQ